MTDQLQDGSVSKDVAGNGAARLFKDPRGSEDIEQALSRAIVQHVISAARLASLLLKG